MASSGDGEPVQYLYTPDIEDEYFQQNLMLTHPTNILKLDDEGMMNANPSTAAGGNRYDGENNQFAGHQADSDEESVEVSYTTLFLCRETGGEIHNFGQTCMLFVKNN